MHQGITDKNTVLLKLHPIIKKLAKPSSALLSLLLAAIMLRNYFLHDFMSLSHCC